MPSFISIVRSLTFQYYSRRCLISTASETLLLLQPIFDSIRNSTFQQHSHDGSLVCSFPMSQATSSSDLFSISQKYTPKITLSHSHSHCQLVS
jgi:hypothetical protein